MAQKWIDVKCCAAVLLVLALFTVSAGAEQSTVISKTSYYEHVKVSDIDTSAINATYNNVRSIVTCGIKCSGISAKSFYFVSNSSKCHCNALWMDIDTLAVEQSNIAYGKLTKEIVTEKIVTESPPTESYSDCQEVYMLGFRTNGTYTIRLGNGTTDVFCDLSDGGWTVFQRRFDGSVDFERNWTDYVNGFGDLDGEFWLGLETLHQITKDGCELLILIDAKPNQTIQDTGYAKYTHFAIGNSSSAYTLDINGFSGNAGDSMAFHDGLKFSTFDMDNDASPDNCAVIFPAGWWFNRCFRSLLNGQYNGPSSGVYWMTTWNYIPLARAEMKFRC